MKKFKNILLRILVCPFVLGIVFVKFNYHVVERFVLFLMYGGEFVSYAKEEKETIENFVNKMNEIYAKKWWRFLDSELQLVPNETE